MFNLSLLFAQNPYNFVLAWLLLILSVAAVYDIYQRRIPNLLVLLGLAVLLILQAWLQALQPLSLLLGFIVGLTAWQLKLIGGGDSKLLIFVSAAFAPTHLLTIYLCIAGAGAIQALVAIVFKQNKKLPYAVAILVGTITGIIYSCSKY